MSKVDRTPEEQAADEEALRTILHGLSDFFSGKAFIRAFTTQPTGSSIHGGFTDLLFFRPKDHENEKI